MSMTIPSLRFADRPRYFFRLILPLIVLCGIAAAADVRAQTAEPKPATGAGAGGDMRTRYERAVALYNSSQYDKAIEEFQAVYEMKPAPILLFNLAQAHRKAGHKAQALDLYDRFLRENPPLDPKAKPPEVEQYNKLKSETELYIKELKTSLEADKLAEKEAADKVAADKLAAEQKVAAEKAAAQRAADERIVAAQRYRNRPTRPLNIAKWALAGVGLGLVIAGAVLVGFDGKPVCSDDAPLMPGQKLCPNELDTKALGGGLLGGGLAALAGSAALFIVDYRQTHGTQRASELASLEIRF